jgi:integrase/recombinase XerD
LKIAGRVVIWVFLSYQHRRVQSCNTTDLETAIGCHTFRATGITDYLSNGGRIEIAQRLPGHAKTTGLYDRRNDEISVGEIEKIGI